MLPFALRETGALHMIRVRLIVLSLAVLVVSACSPRGAARTSEDPDARRPIVLQGAMDSEVQTLVAALEAPSEQDVDGWMFWTGTIAGEPVVVSRTRKGTANAAAATALAVERFHPRAIVNQGTAGGHDPSLHVADVVLGAEAINIGAFKTGSRTRGAGSDFREWLPLDLLQSEGSAGQDPNAWKMHRFPADPALLAAAERAKARYTRGRVVSGVIGSSDMWNSELDRIARFHEAFGTSVEEMETAPAAQVASLAHVPFLGIRILSNNITNGDAYDGGTAAACQQFVLDVVREYVGVHQPPHATR